MIVEPKNNGDYVNDFLSIFEIENDFKFEIGIFRGEMNL